MGIFNFKKPDYKIIKKEKEVKTGNDFLDSPTLPFELKQEIKQKLPNYIPAFYDNGYNTEVRCLGRILSGTITQIFDFELAKKIFFIILSSNDVYEIYKANSLMIGFYEKFYKENNCTFQELEKACLAEIAFLPFYYLVAIKESETIFSNGIYRLSIELKKQQAWDKLVELCKIALFFNIENDRISKLILLASKKKVIEPYFYKELKFSSKTLNDYICDAKNRVVNFESVKEYFKKIFGQ